MVMVVELVMLARLAIVAGEGVVMVAVVIEASPGELLVAPSAAAMMVVLGEVVDVPL